MTKYNRPAFDSSVRRHLYRHTVIQKRHSVLEHSDNASAAYAMAHDLESHINQYTDDRDTSDGQLIST